MLGRVAAITNECLTPEKSEQEQFIYINKWQSPKFQFSVTRAEEIGKGRREIAWGRIMRESSFSRKLSGA